MILFQPPEVGDHVMFTKDIIDALKKSGWKSVFILYADTELVVTKIYKFQGGVTVNFTSGICSNYISILEDGTISGATTPDMHKIPVFFLISGERDCLSNQSVPKNNDGREECFWCPGTKTKQVDTGFSIWNNCPKCGR